MRVQKKPATIYALHTALDSMGISEIIALRWLEIGSRCSISIYSSKQWLSTCIHNVKDSMGPTLKLTQTLKLHSKSSKNIHKS